MTTETMETITSFFANQIENKKFHTGYLLTGPDTERRKEIARGFSKALNCLDLGDSPWNSGQSPSNSCQSCRKIDSGNHPDVRWYGVDEDVRSIKIEEVRDLQNWLSLKPYEGKVKVFVLNEADRLTPEAQNAMLKSLEEPPPQSVFILLADKKSDLLETVVSRVVEIKVTPYTEEEIIKTLKNEGVENSDAKFLARFSQGNLGYARKLSSSGWLKTNRETLKNILNDKIQGFDALQSRSRKEVIEFLNVFSAFVRDLCVLKMSDSAKFLVLEDRYDILKSILQNKTPEAAFQLFEQIEETQKAIEDNVNQKLALARLQMIWWEFLSGEVGSRK